MTAELINTTTVLSVSAVWNHTVLAGLLTQPHICSVSPKQPQPPLPPSCYKHTGAMISLFPSGRTRPDRHYLRPRPVSLSPGHGSVLTDTDSLRHSRASGAPLLFWPTRKSPRQATPPPRHREQQHGDWRRTREQMATVGGNDRSTDGEGRKIPTRSGSERQTSCHVKRLAKWQNCFKQFPSSFCNKNSTDLFDGL